MKCKRHEDHSPAVRIRIFPTEHPENRQQEYHATVFERFHKFLVVSPLQHIMHAVQHDSDHQVKQSDEHSYGCIQVLSIRGQTLMSEKISQKECDLQTQHVQHYEIKVFNPSL